MVVLPPDRRLWLCFFSQGQGSAWWKRFLPYGFCHVSAAAWYVEAERWVFVDATRAGVTIEVWRADDFNARLGLLIRDSHAILRVPSADEPIFPPRAWWCVGMVKALLGYRTRALLPHQLYRHLLQKGAEIVEVSSGQLHQDSEGAGARS